MTTKNFVTYSSLYNRFFDPPGLLPLTVPLPYGLKASRKPGCLGFTIQTTRGSLDVERAYSDQEPDKRLTAYSWNNLMKTKWSKQLYSLIPFKFSGDCVLNDAGTRGGSYVCLDLSNTGFSDAVFKMNTVYGQSSVQQTVGLEFGNTKYGHTSLRCPVMVWDDDEGKPFVKHLNKESITVPCSYFERNDLMSGTQFHEITDLKCFLTKCFEVSGGVGTTAMADAYKRLMSLKASMSKWEVRMWQRPKGSGLDVVKASQVTGFRDINEKILQRMQRPYLSLSRYIPFYKDCYDSIERAAFAVLYVFLPDNPQDGTLEWLCECNYKFLPTTATVAIPEQILGRVMRNTPEEICTTFSSNMLSKNLGLM